MSFSFGVYEIFSYSLPGGLQIFVLSYILDRFGWVDYTAILNLPTGILLVGGLGGSLLIGNLLYPPALKLVKSKNQSILTDEVERFVRWNPDHAGRSFLNAGFPALQAAVSMHKPETRGEIDSLAAQGLMLRNAVIPLGNGTLVALAELFLSTKPFFALTACLFLAIATALAYRGGLRYFKWQVRATFNYAVWVPEIDRLG